MKFAWRLRVTILASFFVLAGVLGVFSNKMLPRIHAASASGTAVQINAGGNAASPFIADTDFSGGSTANSGNTIDTSGSEQSCSTSCLPVQSLWQLHIHYS